MLWNFVRFGALFCSRRRDYLTRWRGFVLRNGTMFLYTSGGFSALSGAFLTAFCILCLEFPVAQTQIANSRIVPGSGGVGRACRHTPSCRRNTAADIVAWHPRDIVTRRIEGRLVRQGYRHTAPPGYRHTAPHHIATRRSTTSSHGSPPYRHTVLHHSVTR
jgi:hypothetical protein